MGLSSSKNDDIDTDSPVDSNNFFPETRAYVDIDYDMQFLLSLSTVVIKADNCPILFRKTLVFPDDYSNWKVILIMHNKLVNYIVENNLLAKIVISNIKNGSHHTFSSRLLDTCAIGSTDFTSYNFYCECPIEKKNRYSVSIELENYKHNLFEIGVTNDIYDDNCESYYDIFTQGFSKFGGDEFTKYWSLCVEDIQNISKITHYFIKKNNINEEHILDDPWFAMLSATEKVDTAILFDKLNLLNTNVDWKKLYDISVDFYSKYKYETRHIKNGLQKLPSIIGSTASTNKNVDINTIGFLCQITLSRIKNLVPVKYIY